MGSLTLSRYTYLQRFGSISFDVNPDPDPGIHIGKSGYGSESSDPPFRNSGSGSSDPHLKKVDPDPDLDPSTLNIFRI